VNRHICNDFNLVFFRYPIEQATWESDENINIPGSDMLTSAFRKSAMAEGLDPDATTPIFLQEAMCWKNVPIKPAK
jgi:hypothetical protein